MSMNPINENEIRGNAIKKFTRKKFPQNVLNVNSTNAMCDDCT
jgi:hypothetical protein